MFRHFFDSLDMYTGGLAVQVGRLIRGLSWLGPHHGNHRANVTARICLCLEIGSPLMVIGAYPRFRAALAHDGGSVWLFVGKSGSVTIRCESNLLHGVFNNLYRCRVIFVFFFFLLSLFMHWPRFGREIPHDGRVSFINFWRRCACDRVAMRP